MGVELVKGYGTGGSPELGEQAAEEQAEVIASALRDMDMVIIVCGMGGGAGTGAASVVAKIAKDMGILTVGVVSEPFDFEGKNRKDKAFHGIESLKSSLDTLVVIPNQQSLESEGQPTLENILKKSDEVFVHVVQGIASLINRSSLIHMDFLDICSAMKEVKVMAYVRRELGTTSYPFEVLVFQSLESALEKETAIGAIMRQFTEQFFSLDAALEDDYEFQADWNTQTLNYVEKCGKMAASFDFVMDRQDQMKSRIEIAKKIDKIYDRYFVITGTAVDSKAWIEGFSADYPELCLVQLRHSEEEILSLWRLPRVVFTYNCGREIERNIADKYGEAVEIHDCTDQWQDLLAVCCDVMVINAENLPDEAAAALNEYWDDLEWTDLPELYVLGDEGAQKRLKNAKIWQ